MKTSRLSRRLESIIKFIVQLLPLFVIFVSIFSFFQLNINFDTQNIDTIYSSTYIQNFLIGVLENFTGFENNGSYWLDVFGISKLFESISNFFGFERNAYNSIFEFAFLYIGWLIFVEFLWLIKDILLACPRIVSKFINKLTGGDLD